MVNWKTTTISQLSLLRSELNQFIDEYFQIRFILNLKALQTIAKQFLFLRKKLFLLFLILLIESDYR